MTQTINQRAVLSRARKPRCPKDVSENAFRRMMDAVPDGFRYVKTRVPKYPFPYWRDFHFIAERKPAQKTHLKQGDELVLSCARKLRVR